MFRRDDALRVQSYLLLALFLITGSLVRAGDPDPIGANEPPILEVKKIEKDKEVCGTATDDNPPIEITIERIGQSGNVPVATNPDGSFVTCGTSGDAPGTEYRVTAVDKFGNKTTKTVTR